MRETGVKHSNVKWLKMRTVHFKHKMIGFSFAVGVNDNKEFQISILVPGHTFLFVKEGKNDYDAL